MALSMLLACWKLVDLKNNNNSQQEWEGGQWSGSSRKFYLVYFWCQRPLCVAKAWCQKPPDNAPSPSNTTGWHTPHAQQPGTTMEGYGETNSNWTIDNVKCPLIVMKESIWKSIIFLEYKNCHTWQQISKLWQLTNSLSQGFGPARRTR